MGFGVLVSLEFGGFGFGGMVFVPRVLLRFGWFHVEAMVEEQEQLAACTLIIAARLRSARPVKMPENAALNPNLMLKPEPETSIYCCTLRKSLPPSRSMRSTRGRQLSSAV